VAKTLGLAEQQREFKPSPTQAVSGDVDISMFSSNTIGVLNVMMKLYSKGISLEGIMDVLQASEKPGSDEELMNDLLKKRNAHLLGEIKKRLDESDHLVVPWGAAHIPEIAREIQKDGFQLHGSNNYQVIKFSSRKRNAIPAVKPVEKEPDSHPAPPAAQTNSDPT
jgi:hypothetical protein